MTEGSVLDHVVGLELPISSELDVRVVRCLHLLMFNLLFWHLRLGLLVMVGEAWRGSG